MGTAGSRWLLSLVLLGGPGLAAGALVEPEICYVLDAILFLYSLILTGLYCRLRFMARRSRGAPEQKEEAVYAGLSAGNQETYETLQMKHS
ncbi:high affinity immunoglobulin epsilon receptor subunit gamma [Corvus hawaiiensis]|uniref:high affinity immunoglobulin epsilon receptor subunit gamma n=1 Tax=Corvus moneduloides TaxID=1196302 RepID=UPI001362E555|nr:high affinity immunoglobulin epsilon receptor subunit gamma [Corvus moneduloides]XP_048144578.1 high affinity immunoglobulin epsilon receptor subunit gamma [Corvus hawaiiensis]